VTGRWRGWGGGAEPGPGSTGRRRAAGRGWASRPGRDWPGPRPGSPSGPVPHVHALLRVPGQREDLGEVTPGGSQSSRSLRDSPDQVPGGLSLPGTGRRWPRERCPRGDRWGDWLNPGVPGDRDGLRARGRLGVENTRPRKEDRCELSPRECPRGQVRSRGSGGGSVPGPLPALPGVQIGV
jgi:hypothetical protein